MKIVLGIYKFNRSEMIQVTNRNVDTEGYPFNNILDEIELMEFGFEPIPVIKEAIKRCNQIIFFLDGMLPNYGGVTEQELDYIIKNDYQHKTVFLLDGIVLGVDEVIQRLELNIA